MKWTVLIVEDDAETGQRMAEVVGKEVRTRIAYNGQEAILFAGKRPPELVIIDVDVPAVDGIEVSRFFKTKFGETAVPILIVTEKDDERTRVACAEVGCDDFLTDPYELAELSTLAGSLAKLGRTEQSLIKLERRREASKKGLAPEEDDAEELIQVICDLRATIAGRLIGRGFGELAHGHIARISALDPDHAALGRLRDQLS